MVLKFNTGAFSNLTYGSYFRFCYGQLYNQHQEYRFGQNKRVPRTIFSLWCGHLPCLHRFSQENTSCKQLFFVLPFRILLFPYNRVSGDQPQTQFWENTYWKLVLILKLIWYVNKCICYDVISQNFVFEVGFFSQMVMRLNGLFPLFQIWNCESCYTAFHLLCIQRWAKDTVYQQAQNMEPGLGELPIRDKSFKKLQWCCPKCRSPYSEVCHTLLKYIS